MDELGKGFWWKTVGIVIGLGVLGLIGWVIFDALVWRFGAIGALVVVFGILMVFAYRSDKKSSANGTMTRRRPGSRPSKTETVTRSPRSRGPRGAAGSPSGTPAALDRDSLRSRVPSPAARRRGL